MVGRRPLPHGRLFHGGTDGSKPSSSSGESARNCAGRGRPRAQAQEAEKRNCISPLASPPDHYSPQAERRTILPDPHGPTRSASSPWHTSIETSCSSSIGLNGGRKITCHRQGRYPRADPASRREHQNLPRSRRRHLGRHRQDQYLRDRLRRVRQAPRHEDALFRPGNADQHDGPDQPSCRPRRDG